MRSGRSRPVNALPPLDIIVVNFNSGSHLAACLASVRAHVPDAHTFVVDNASTDDSARAADGLAEVTLARQPLNVGFAAGVNAGLRLGRAPRVLLLNPDCVLREDSLPALHAELDAHPACAIAGPRVLNEDGTVQGSVRGDPTLLTGLFGRTSLLARWFPGSSIARRNVRTLAPDTGTRSDAVDWVSGACMLARRDVIEAAGGFDERYFLYWEDADLCRRLRGAGHTVRYVPSATVVHIGGRSSASAKDLSIRAFHRSAFEYYRIHVARTPLSRAFAWLVLTVRCAWKRAATRLKAT